MKLLVLTSEPVSASQVRGALGGEGDPREAEVMVVAPALQDSPIKFWTSDADDAIARAQAVTEATVRELGEAGVPASGDTGESDPFDAIQDALASFAADRILIFVRPQGDQGYREEVDPEEVRDRFGLPVTVAHLQG